VAIQPDEYLSLAAKDNQRHPNPVRELAIALGSLLILSIFLSATSMAISLTCDSCFDKLVLLASGPDLVVLAGCGTMLYFIVFGYPTMWTAPQLGTGQSYSTRRLARDFSRIQHLLPSCILPS